MPMVLCPVDRPAEVHSTAISALRNEKIFEVGGLPPLTFVPGRTATDDSSATNEGTLLNFLKSYG